MISASSSSTTRMRQYRRQMKKMKVLRGFTNQLKEVLGRLLGKGGVSDQEAPASDPTYPSSGYLLGLLQRLWLLSPLPNRPLLCLLHS